MRNSKKGDGQFGKEDGEQTVWVGVSSLGSNYTEKTTSEVNEDRGVRLM